MKKALLFLLLFVPSLLRAQTFQEVWREAQKFKADSDFKSAIAVYDKVIQKVLAGEQTYPEVEWIGLLVQAGRYYHNRTNKYDNLLYGTKAEKYKEKIDFLKDAGVKQIISYEINDHTFGYLNFVYSSCQSRRNKTLLWVMNGHVYMQAFDECNTYKPLKMEDPQIAALITQHYKNLADDSLKLPIYMPEKTVDYHFQFYAGSDTITKKPVSIFYLKSEDKDNPAWPVKKASDLQPNEVSIYKQNGNSYLGQLLPAVMEIEQKYKAFINSPAEKAKVGKIE